MSGSLDKVSEASSRLSTAQEELKNRKSELNLLQERNAGSLKELALGASGAATAGFSLYSSFDRIQKAELAVDRANLQVRTSTKGVEDAQRNLKAAVVEHGDQ